MDLPYVVVAEDEWIIGQDICQTVAEAGYEVEGPLSDVSAAMLAYQKRKPDIAILDINLGRDNVFPLAQMLMAEDVKVIFHSGEFGADEVALRFPDALVIEKPCAPAQLIDTVSQSLSQG